MLEEVRYGGNKMKFQHEPVLLAEVIKSMNLQSDGTYVDCTLGGAGHSLAILQAQSRIKLVGIDQDPSALLAAKKRLLPYLDRVTFIHDNFKNLSSVLTELNIPRVDGILMDIGVSSHQFDQAERGFSYQHNAPLDMRMNPQNPVTAKTLVNTLTEHELTQIIFDYGEERWAKRISQFIVEKRSLEPIESTEQLVDAIKAAIPASARREGPHPARRTFQALRIAVNRELEVFEEAIYHAVDALSSGGRLCVITFHSLEDRIAKETFKKLSTGCTCPANFPICVCNQKPKIRLVTRKPIIASKEELGRNSRARSAKLRVCERLDGRELSQ